MVNLWKSKKGAIPIVSEIVTIVMGILPAPVKVALFILLFTVIASFVIPAILSLWGYSCVYESGQYELYQVPLSGTFGKVSYEINEFLRDFIGIQDYELPENPFPQNNKTFLRIPEECFTTQEINGTDRSGYSALCVNCTYEPKWYSYILGKDDTTICLSDGYYEPLSNFASTGAKKFCAICNPPYPYYFNITNCPSIDNCYFTIENVSLIPYVGDDYEDEIYLNRLKELGGVKRAQDSNEFINVQCTANRQPSLYLYSIEIFNKTMWIVLIVGTFLVQFAMMWYGLILRM